MTNWAPIGAPGRSFVRRPDGGPADAGLTGLAYNSGSLTWYYWREDTGNSGGVSVTLATATRGTFTSGGFKEIDATNLPGWYEIGIPDAVLASGAYWAIMELKGATNMAPVLIEIQLVTYDPTDGNLGLTGLSGLTAPTAGALPTVGSGSNQISLNSGYVDAALKKVIGTTLTETSTGYLAAAIKKFFDVATPAGTINSLPGADADTNGGLPVIGTGTRQINPNAGGIPLSFTGRQQVWDFLIADVTPAVGSFAELFIATLDAAISSRLAPTTAGRTLDVSATGEAGLDFDNIKDATGAHTLTNITVPVVTTTGTVNALASNAITSSVIQDGAITDAKFTLPTIGAHTLATGPIGMIMQSWRADHYVEKFDSGTGDLKRYASDGTTVLLVLPCTDTLGVQTRGAAS